MAGADMRSKSADRFTSAVAAENAAKKAEATKAKSALPNLDAYAAIKNPSSKQVEEAINLLAAALSSALRSG